MSHSVLAFVSGKSAAAGATLLLDAAIKGVLVLVAVGVVVLAMRRASAAMRHLVWTAGLLSLLVLPLLSVVVPRWEALPVWLRPEWIVGTAFVPEAAPDATLAPDPPTSPLPEQASRDAVAAPSLPFSEAAIHSPLAASPRPAAGEAQPTDRARVSSGPAWVAATLWIWGAVTAVLLLRIVVSRFILARVVRSASPIEDGPIHDQIAAVRRRYRIGHAVHAFLSGERELPMTWGVFRAHVLLPSEAAGWPLGRLDAVLLHELAHVKRRDTITHVVGQVACAVYWFNPLVWLAAWRIHVERERACDNLVITSGVKSSEYAEHLLRIVGNCRSRRAVPCSAVAMAKPSRLEGRLLAILNDRLNRQAATKSLLATVLVAAASGVVAVAMLRAQSGVENSDDAGSGEVIELPVDSGLGEVVELVVSDDTGQAPLVDFDRGIVGAPPEELKEEQDEAAILAWMAESGFDAIGDTNGRDRGGLIGFDMIARFRGDDEWNAPFAHVNERLAVGDPGSPMVMAAQGFPSTFFIRTREGGTGIVQITGIAEEPRGVRIRLKMLARNPAGGEEKNAAIDPEVRGLIDQINTLIAAALSERYDEASKLAGPDFRRGQLEDFADFDVDALRVDALYFNAANALAITNVMPVNNPGGLELGRLVLTLEKKESWQLRDIDFETDESLQGEIDRFREEHPDAERREAGTTRRRRFVRLVVGLNGAMTFEGNATTWQELPAALDKVPNREDTVLEFAISTDQVTVAQLNEIRTRAATLAIDHGFEYASDIGIHPLGSKGSPAAEREGGEESSGPPIKFGEPNAAQWEFRPLVELNEPAYLAEHEDEDERFDPIVRLAGLTDAEANVLDELLRGQAFEGLNGLKAYDPAEYSGDAQTLRRALGKLFDLEKKQTAELNRVEGQLELDTLSEVERTFLQQEQTRIRHEHARNVLSIRQAFRHDPAGDARANWTALSKFNLAHGNHRYMASARAPVGGEFPVRFEEENQDRFRVRVIDGDDKALTIKVIYQIDDLPVDPIEADAQLSRDQPVEFEVNGYTFSILYPSTYVARSSEPTTDLAMIIVSYRPADNVNGADRIDQRPPVDPNEANEAANEEPDNNVVHDGRIRGKVVNAETGAPIAGAYVGVGDLGDSGGSNYERHREHGLYASATTADDGTFELTGLTYTGQESSVPHHPLIVAHQDFVSLRQNVELRKGAEPTIAVEMKPAARLQVTIQDAQGNPERSTYLVRIEALDGHRFIPPGHDRHLSAFASSRWTEYVNGGTFMFTELQPGEYAIDAFRLGPGREGDRSSTRYPPLSETGTAYHAGLPRIALSAGQLEVLGLKPQNHGTRVTIRLPDFASSKLSADQVRAMREMMLVTISRNIGLLAWDDNLVHSLEDPRLGRILGSELFTGQAVGIERFTIENLPPGSYSVFAGPAPSLSGARLDVDPGTATELDISWKEPQGFASVPVHGLNRIVQLPKQEYAVAELLDVLTAATAAKPALTAAESIADERVTPPAREMQIWQVLESLYLSRGWRLAEEGQGSRGALVLRP